MAKKKAAAKSTPVVEEVVKEVEEVSTPVEEEKTKEQICEFYGISDKEVFDLDFEKYWVKKEEAKILEDWAKENAKSKAWDVEFNIYKGSEEVRAIIAKYWITAEQAANWELDELSEEEKKIITDYYHELINSL